MSKQLPRSVMAAQIDAWLPQTQCTQCGYPRCRAYAEALAAGSADIDQCPPGGAVTLQALAALLHLPVKPLNPRYGEHKPRARAVIDETLCIGCRKCIDACPVDAILGARKLMHTVIAHECTGCELCLPPCPVDCIVLVPNLTGHARSASGSDHTKPPLPQRGRGVGERDDRPHPLFPPGRRKIVCARSAGERSTGPFPVSASPPEGRGEVGEKLHFDRNEGEGAHSGEPWPEYPRAETDRWRVRTENRLHRLAQHKRARVASRPSDSVPASDRERIRAEISAAVERVKTKKQNRRP